MGRRRRLLMGAGADAAAGGGTGMSWVRRAVNLNAPGGSAPVMGMEAAYPLSCRMTAFDPGATCRARPPDDRFAPNLGR